MRRLAHSIHQWHEHPDRYELARNTAQGRSLDHFISFVELQRLVLKNQWKRKPVIATLHHLDKLRRHKSLVPVFDACDVICVVSHQWRRHLIQVEGLHPHKVRVIYNGYLHEDVYDDDANSPKPIFVQAEHRRRELRQEFQIPADAFVVGHQGREDEWRKDCKTYYKTLDRLGHAVYPLFFEECSYPRGHKNMARHGYGRYNDLYALMDLYVISSLREGGPVGYLEAVQAGIPVISTKVGMAWDFSPEKYLCDTESYKELADLILWAKKDYSTIKEEFSIIREQTKWLTWQSIAHQYHDLYWELLCQR